VQNLLVDQGIICSPSAIHGINHQNANLFDLKRIMVGFMGEHINLPIFQ
jgi:hypothetical protein